MSLSAHLWHDSALNVQTLTEADGKVGWGVYGSTWAYREGVGGERSGGGLGRFTIAGRVVDESGNGVADMELQVGKQTVYIGARGDFVVSINKRKRYKLTIAVEDFLTVGWRVVSAPAEVTPEDPVVIVVARSVNQANPK